MTDNLSKHEVLDRTHLLADMFDRYVLEHPVLQNDPDLKQRAAAILEQLYQLYQTAGERLSHPKHEARG